MLYYHAPETTLYCKWEVINWIELNEWAQIWSQLLAHLRLKQSVFSKARSTYVDRQSALHHAAFPPNRCEIRGKTRKNLHTPRNFFFMHVFLKHHSCIPVDHFRLQPVYWNVKIFVNLRKPLCIWQPSDIWKKIDVLVFISFVSMSNTLMASNVSHCIFKFLAGTN